MYKLQNLKLPPDYTNADVKAALANRLGVSVEEIVSCSVIKQSIDARKRSNIHCILSVSFELAGNASPKSDKDISSYFPIEYFIPSAPSTDSRPIVVGSGPAGLFAAFVLAKAGLRPLILERGKPVEQRMEDVDRFWRSGVLNPESNVQFGEGGAGTFSDGKLTTGIKDPRCRFVLETFVQHGAPEEILYLSKPHIGTDRLTAVLQRMRKDILSSGGEFLFSHQLTGVQLRDGALHAIQVKRNREILEFPVQYLLLAIGHSARDTFEMLFESDLRMEPKAFSAGLRIEHPQSLVDLAQYGRPRDMLPPADYKLSHRLPDGRGVYTFCMCPGGQVVAAASEPGHLVVNGMSPYARDGGNANSAVLVSVTPDDFGQSAPLAGVAFQRRLEQAAYAVHGGYIAPAQRVEDFYAGRASSGFHSVQPSYRPGVAGADLAKILPAFITEGIKQGLQAFDRRLRGFSLPDAVLTGVETRSSSPVRILRGERYQANIEGIFPCGEGCGYAGGIMSAAVDGIRCAEQVIRELGGTIEA